MTGDVASPIGAIIGQVDPQFIAVAIGSVLLIAAALHDVAARTIPNWVSLLLALLGCGLRWADGQILPSLGLAFVVFAASVLCWRRGWMGGGDVKLLVAAAIFVPPAHVGTLLTAITLAGGVVGLLYVSFRTVLRRLSVAFGPKPRRKLARIVRAERWRLLRGASLPYASAIAVGTLFVIVSG